MLIFCHSGQFEILAYAEAKTSRLIGFQGYSQCRETQHIFNCIPSNLKAHCSAREGRAKIADVGLSKVLNNTYLSQLDGLGTFAYAAPELLSGGSNCSFKADIWR